MKSRFAAILVTAVSLASVRCVVQAEEAYPKAPKAVLERFLQLDSSAAGLSPSTYTELVRYTTWGQAPAWDGFVVIDRYEVGKISVGTTRALAMVTYHVLGKLASAFTADTKTEVVSFHINKIDNAWKVDSPQIPPHVSWDVMKKRLEAASVSDPKVKATNDSLIAQIAAAKQTAR